MGPGGETRSTIWVALQRKAVEPEWLEERKDASAFEGSWPAEEKPEIGEIYDRQGAQDSFTSIRTPRVSTDGRIWLRG